MAAKRLPSLSRKTVLKPARDDSEVKEAGKRALAEDREPNMTHQGPGTGKAGAADPRASAAILNSGKTSTATAETKAPAASSKTSEVESAGETIRDRLVEERLKAGASGDESTGKLTTPRLPGEQSADSGTAGSGTAPGDGKGATSGGGGTRSGSGSGTAGSESGGSGSATSEGGSDPFGFNTALDRLDAATAQAQSQLDAARPDLKGGLDVFTSTPGASAPEGGAGPGHEDQLAAAAAGSKFGTAREADDPGAEHAAEVAGQVTGGRGSTGSMFGERLADAKADLALSEALLGDASTKSSSPSVADGTVDNVVGAATGFAGVAGYVSGGAAAAEAALAAGAVTATPVVAGVVAVGGGSYLATRKLDEATGAGEAVVDAVAGMTDSHHVDAMKTAIAERNRVAAQAEREAAQSSGQSTEPAVDGQSTEPDPNGQSTEPDPNGQSTEPGGGVRDPGSPDGPEGGKPTPAQMAFRASLREALGAPRTGSGDIDPANSDATNAPSGLGPFAGAANNNQGLIGDPAGPESWVGGTMHAPVTGTDVDPVEGSAYTGPALGGNPEDVSFGSSTLPLDTLPKSSSSDDDSDSSEDDEEEDDDA
ncbi:MAG: hypothetical protein HS107_10880 [Thermoflexaceae bacterium]|nr:hypothetical protein [Thermoflexaceae bacterium]